MSFIPLANPLPTTDIVASVGDTVDTSNSTSVPLGISGVFTGAWVEVLKYAQVAVIVISDQNSNANGVQVQFSSDGISVDHTHSYSYTAAFGHAIQVHTHARYYRVVYTNGAVAQTTFRLQAVLRPVAGSGSIIEVGDIPTGADDAVLTKSVLVGQTLGTSTYSNVKTNIDGSLIINQNTQIDAANSSTVNLAAGASFIGATTTDLNLTAVQFFIATDQNCKVFIQQSSNGINWDISDEYDYYAALGGSGQSAQLVGSYYRMQVTNVGTATTTFFRFQTIQIPFLNPLPRALDENGDLQVGVKSAIDDSGFPLRHTPRGEQMSVPPFKLIGQTFTDAAIDAQLWTFSVGTGGTVTEANGQLTMSTGTTANNSVNIVSTSTARYVSSTTQLFRTTVRLPDTGTVNNIRRGGMFTATDGAFYEMNGTTFRFVVRKGGVDTAISNGSFNGKYGNTFAFDTNVHIYEILYNSEYVYFIIDNKLIHTIESQLAPWTSTLHLPIRFENTNSGGSTTNVSMEIRSASTSRLGLPNTQPINRFQSGLTAGLTLKSSPGNLQSIIISGVTSTSVVTLYDNTTATGTIIWSSGSMTIGSQSSNLPLYIDFKGISFSTGLTLAITTAACNVSVLYE